MGFASTNGGTLARRSTAAHGPRCAAAARATRRQARNHTNLVLLTCLLENPLWRLIGSVEAATARQLGEAVRWRRVRQTGPGRECGAEEAARRRPQEMRRGGGMAT
jgi:hypothetical protein